MAEAFFVEFVGSPLFIGQQVQARVVLRSAKPMRARAINVHIRGVGEVRWSESEQKSRVMGYRRQSVDYTEVTDYRTTEVQMDQRLTVWSGQEQLIPGGENVFPFLFTIPAGAAPSFEGKWGSIRYCCSVSIDRQWKFDKKVTVPFPVVPYTDLNTIGWALTPVVQCLQKPVGCFGNGRLSAKILMPHSGFVPGQRVPISVEIDNASSKEVRAVRAKLYANATYRVAQGKNKYGEKAKSKVVTLMEKRFTVKAKTKGTFHGELAVPPDCVPSFSTSAIIQLWHLLEIKLETHGVLGSTISARFPVLVGTVAIIPRQEAIAVSPNVAACPRPPAEANPEPPAYGFCVPSDSE